MNESRISQLLARSRSRHEVLISPELRKISKEWQEQKRVSKQSNEEFRKMIREMRYMQSLNNKLETSVLKKRRVMTFAQSTRQRHKEDQRKKQALQKLRTENIKRNKSIANKIKQDRQKRISAIKRSIFEKESVADYYRYQSKKLRSFRLDNQKQQYSNNRSRVEQIVEFECNLRESAIRRKQSENISHIKRYQQNISQERQREKMRERKSLQIKKHLKSLTESSTKKIRQIQDIDLSLIKFKSPYRLPQTTKNRQKRSNQRCPTDKQFSESEQESTIFLSHYPHNDE